MNSKASISNLAAIAAAVFLLTVCACEDEEEYRDFNTQTVRPGMTTIEARKRLRRREGTGLIKRAPEEAESESKLELPQLKETDFIRSLKRRDPFDQFVEIFSAGDQSDRKVQREVKLKEYDVSDLKLIGIITNIGDPRAMVVVPDGTGFVLKRGDYVGRPDFVQQGNRGEPIQVNWKVSRVHGSGKEEERGVYLVRDDPTTTKGVDITRFLPLHPSS